MRFGNLVTVVEEADFRAVAAWRANFEAGTLGKGNRECDRLDHGPNFIQTGGRMSESEGLEWSEKNQNAQ